MMKSKRYVEYFQQDIHLGIIYDYSSTDILPKCSLLPYPYDFTKYF